MLATLFGPDNTYLESGVPVKMGLHVGPADEML